MTDVAQSTIAQAIYADTHGCNFARVVSELESLLSRLRNQAIRTRWDCEDIVIFDIGETRIVLAWSEDRSEDLPVCLLVSVGPLPFTVPPPTDPAHELLCSRLVESIQNRYPPEAVLWRQLPLAIEADLVDALIDSLPPATDTLKDHPPNRGTQRPPETPPPGGGHTTPAAGPFDPANDRPDLPPFDPAPLAGVRAALYAPPGSGPSESPQMRLAAQAMNATLIMVWMPLGVAVMTYSLLKGEKIEFSARMMAVTGTFVGLSQTPLMQQFASFAGV